MVAAFIIVGLLISVAAIAVLNVYGLPIVVVVLLAVLYAFAATRRKGEALGTRDVSKGPEPTGRVRGSRGAPDTANERQGQG